MGVESLRNRLLERVLYMITPSGGPVAASPSRTVLSSDAVIDLPAVRAKSDGREAIVARSAAGLPLRAGGAPAMAVS